MFRQSLVCRPLRNVAPGLLHGPITRSRLIAPPVAAWSPAYICTNIQTLTSRRFLSLTPVRRNLVSDLYIQQIKAFKPTPLSAKEVESAVKAFQLPAKPSPPSEDISAEALSQYEASDVETAEVGAAEGSGVAAEEDWFVFEEETDGHH